MHRRHDPSPELIRLASLQGGVLTREQSLADGLPVAAVNRLVSQGRWRREVPGVYQTNPSDHGFHATAWAGVLSAGDGAMLGRHAAGHVLGICREPTDVVTVFVEASSRRQVPAGVETVRMRDLPPARGLLPCPGPEWTVLNLCEAEPEHLVEWVTAALRQHLTTPERLLRHVRHRPRLRAGVRQRLELLLADAVGLESPLEHLFLRKVLRPHGLPVGERQFREGGRRHDLRIGPVVVELDGRIGHELPTERFRDMHRDNDALVNGLATLRYGWDDCWYRPCGAARQLAVVLERLNYETAAHPCPRCPSLGGRAA